MLLDSCADGEDIHVENNVFRRNAGFGSQDSVGSAADFGLSGESRCLSLLVEGHHHHRRAQSVYFPRLSDELFLSLFEAYGVDYRLALCVLQPGEDRLPMRGVNHHGCLCHSRVVRQASDEARHLGRAVEHGVVHVYVDDRGPVLNLFRRDLQGLASLSCSDQPGEFPGAGDIRPFPYIGEIVVFQVNAHCLEPADDKGTRRGLYWPFPCRAVPYCFNYCAYVFGSRAAASSDYVQQRVFGHLPYGSGHFLRRLRITSHSVGKSSVGVAAYGAFGKSCDLFQKRMNLLRPERTVEPESGKRIMPHGCVEGLYCLPCQSPAAAVAH